jgi:phospholipid/cholesterol/gamma-HCH transport system substrate-binding protein
VVARIEVDRSVPVRTDTRARLEYQGLTGVAQVALIGGEPDSPPLVAGPAQPLPTIFADRSDFQDLIETARNIARRADDILERVDRVISDNEGAIKNTVANVERFSQALSENAGNIDRFLEQVGQAAEKIGPLAGRLETLAGNVDELVRSVDRDRIARIVENADGFAQALGDSRQAITTTLNEAAALSRTLNGIAPKLDATLTDIGKVAGAIDPASLSRTVQNAERFSESVAKSGPDVEKAVAEARSLTEKLNRSADRVDNVLKAAESFLGGAAGEQGPGLFKDIREAAQSIRTLANNLDKRTAEITAGVSRFTNGGLREVESLARDGRRTVDDVGRAVRGLEKNPQQLLFGGRPNLPEYNGRR